MSNDEKIQLIKQTIGDFWDFNERQDKENGALAMITAIYTICTFGEEENET